MKLTFLDKDGTLVKPISSGKFVQSPDDQELISGVREAIECLARDGYKMVIVSNQGGVAAGHKTLDEAIDEMRFVLELLPQIKTAYFCPDFEGEECYAISRDDVEIAHEDAPTECLGEFRKPGAGMLKLAAYQTFEEYLDFDNCLMVGDRDEDEQAAIAAGVPFQWANEWRGDA